MKTTNQSTNQSNRQPSLRVLHDIQSEKEYLEEHPELNNVFTFHCWKVLPRTALYFDRNGKFCLCYPTSYNRRSQWRLLQLDDHVNPGLIKHRINKNYIRVTFKLNNNVCHFTVHRVIADMFINHFDMFATEIDHIDEDRHNNRYDNLEWVTHEENRRRRYYNYYTKRGRPVPDKFLPN